MPALDLAIVTTAMDPRLVEIINTAPVMPLNDAGADADTVQALSAWLKQKPTISQTCLAGLWLLAGDLDRSHTLSQSIESSDGSYWHGIMHRREGDYFNAKYWMRRCNGHPVTEQLKRQVSQYRDALLFVDYVERAVTKDAAMKSEAARIQWLEWQLLFAHCLTGDA